jgi:hypothetical protein
VLPDSLPDAVQQVSHAYVAACLQELRCMCSRCREGRKRATLVSAQDCLACMQAACFRFRTRPPKHYRQQKPPPMQSMAAFLAVKWRSCCLSSGTQSGEEDGCVA